MFAAITYWQLYVFYGGGYCYFIWKMNDLVSVFCICYKSINPLTAISSFLRSSSQTFWLKPGVSRQKPISGPPIKNSHRRLFNLRLYPGSHVWLSPHGTATCYIIGGHSWEKGMKTPAWMEFTESNVFCQNLHEWCTFVQIISMRKMYTMLKSSSPDVSQIKYYYSLKMASWEQKNIEFLYRNGFGLMF